MLRVLLLICLKVCKKVLTKAENRILVLLSLIKLDELEPGIE